MLRDCQAKGIAAADCIEICTSSELLHQTSFLKEGDAVAEDLIVVLTVGFGIAPVTDLLQGCGAGLLQLLQIPGVLGLKYGHAAVDGIMDHYVVAALSVFLVGVHGISGASEDAGQKGMVEILPVVVVTDGPPEERIHFPDDGIVAGVPPVADGLRRRIPLELQEIVHHIPGAIDIDVTEVVAVVPASDGLRLVGASGCRQQLIHLGLHEAEALVQTGAVDGIRHKVVGAGEDAFLRDLQAAGNDGEPQCRVVLQGLEQSPHDIQHFPVVAVAVGLSHGDVVFVDEQDHGLPVMGLQHFRQQQEAVLHLFFRGGGIGQSAEARFLELADIILLQQIAVAVEKGSDDHGEHVVGAGEVQTVHLTEGNKDGRIAVHPRFAELPVLCDFQVLKQGAAVPSDVEEVFQHAHGQGLPEAAGAGDQRHFRAGAGQEFPDQGRLIDVVVAAPADLCKVGNTDGNV